MPTFRHGKNTTVLSDDFDLTTYLNSATVSASIETPETTTFGSSDRSYIVGHNEGIVSFEGLFDGTTDSADSIFSAALGNDTDKVISVSTDSTSVGGRAILVKSASTSYEISSPLTDVVSVSGEAVANEGLDYGVWLGCKSAITATSTGTSVDNTGSSYNGGVGNLHITANTRDATTVAKVQHSSDNSTWADLTTFETIAIGTLTSERIIVAPSTTVNRYLRAVVTPAAGTGSITFSVAFSRR
jgi:hypothetical protein